MVRLSDLVLPTLSAAGGANIVNVTSATARFTDGAYDASNDAWNPGSDVLGVDYTVSARIDREAFPNDVRFAWAWDTKSEVNSVRSYPRLAYNFPATAWGGLSALGCTFDATIGGETGYFSAAFDLFFKDASGNILCEVLINVHTPVAWDLSNQGFTFSSGGLTSAAVFMETGHGAESQPGGWRYVGIQNSVDLLSGSIDLLAILADVEAQGWLNGTELLSEIRFGAETSGGTGTLTLTEFSAVAA